MANHGGDEAGYRDDGAEVWSDEDMARLSLAQQRDLVVWIIEMIKADLAEAIATDSFFAHTNPHTIRAIPQVDERGWRELSQVHRNALDAVLRIQAASAERLAERGEAGIPALSALLCCELPADMRPDPDLPPGIEAPSRSR